MPWIKFLPLGERIGFKYLKIRYFFDCGAHISSDTLPKGILSVIFLTIPSQPDADNPKLASPAGEGLQPFLTGTQILGCLLGAG
jgi:hypothetical protein